jgi:hypothetical protein
VPLADIRQGRFAAASRLGSAEPPGVPETVVGQATLGIGNSESAARSEDPDSAYVVVPKALEISAMCSLLCVAYPYASTFR